MSILSILSADNFITVNRTLVKEVGLEAAVIMGELASEHMYWEARGELRDGFFYSTVENVEDRTGLSAHQQRQALTKLEERGILECRKMGMPAKRFIRLFPEAVLQLFNVQSLKNLTTSDEKIEAQVVKNLEINKTKENKTKEEDITKQVSKKAETFDDILESSPLTANNPELKESCQEYIKMRKLIKKPLTNYALKKALNKAFELAGGDPDKMKAIIDQSVMNSWQGVFPLNETQKTTRKSSGGSYNPFTELMIEEGMM